MLHRRRELLGGAPVLDDVADLHGARLQRVDACGGHHNAMPPAMRVSGRAGVARENIRRPSSTASRHGGHA